MPITQYGSAYTSRTFDSFGAMLDSFFEEKARDEKISQKASDITKLVSSALARSRRKLDIRRKELEDCNKGEKYRLWGDLITANIYRLRRGDSEAALEDYETGKTVTVPLDKRLTPAANAQVYYKKYAKTKSARAHLSEQIRLAEEESAYLSSVADAMTRVSTEKELSEIRAELSAAGFASGLKKNTSKSQVKPSYLTFRTSGGYTVYCGKNNIANDWLTFKKADRHDWWFHAKGVPGSHVIMECAGREEPSAEDFTQACMIAAAYSSLSEQKNAEIDYTEVRYVKKPPQAKPGYVIYHTNWSAAVPVDKETVKKLESAQ